MRLALFHQREVLKDHTATARSVARNQRTNAARWSAKHRHSEKAFHFPPPATHAVDFHLEVLRFSVGR